jgi:hypothetical protein
MKFDKKILHIHQVARRRPGRPTGAPMPTWYDRADGSLRAINASRREAAAANERREKAKAERFQPPKNVPIIRETKSWWPF